MTSEKWAIVIRYLRQPSTFQGIAGLLGVFGVALAPERWEAIAGGVVVIFTLIQIFRDEDKERERTAVAVVDSMEKKGICGPPDPKAILIPLLIVFPMVLQSCATVPGSGQGDDFLSASYKTLSAAAIYYDEAMMAVADAEEAGIIDEAQREEINGFAREFKTAWEEAVDALHAYAQSGAGIGTAEARMEAFTQYYRTFSRRVAPYLIRALA